MQCSSNVKQHLLGIHNYHDTYNVVPGFGLGPHLNYSPHVGLLPFLEQQGRYELIESVKNDDARCDPFADFAAWKGTLGFHCCPSDSNSRAGSQGFTATNYCFSFGDFQDIYPYVSISEVGREPNNTRTFFQQRQQKNVAQGGTGRFNPLHTHFPSIPIELSFSAAGDGLSNTVIISERVSKPDHYLLPRVLMTGTVNEYMYVLGARTKLTDEYNSIKGGILTNNGSVVYASPQTALGYKGPGNTYANYPTDNIPRGGQGTYFGNNSYFSTRFNMILPPNSPSTVMGGALTNFDYDRGMLPPTSNHTGGVNCGLTDGSVRFINETVQVTYTNTVPSGLMVGLVWSGRTQYKTDVAYSGASAFGVWGALGSINGEEPVTVP
jgi:hypothetical protein